MLDLVVVLPCIAAVGVLLIRGRAIAGPLAVVALVKIVTLFTALWAGVLVGLASDAEVHLAADAVPEPADARRERRPRRTLARRAVAGPDPVRAADVLARLSCSD